MPASSITTKLKFESWENDLKFLTFLIGRPTEAVTSHWRASFPTISLFQILIRVGIVVVVAVLFKTRELGRLCVGILP